MLDWASTGEDQLIVYRIRNYSRNARNHPSSADHDEENDDNFLLGTQNWKKGNVEKGKASSSKGDETLANLNIVIAIFIAGTTFASAVQVPGGYDDKGVANLKSKASFKYFLVCNFMAFGFTAGSLMIHFACEILPRVFQCLGREFGGPRSVQFSFVMWFTLSSISSTVGAFMYATEAIMYNSETKFCVASAFKDTVYMEGSSSGCCEPVLLFTLLLPSLSYYASLFG